MRIIILIFLIFAIDAVWAQDINYQKSDNKEQKSLSRASFKLNAQLINSEMNFGRNFNAVSREGNQNQSYKKIQAVAIQSGKTDTITKLYSNDNYTKEKKPENLKVIKAEAILISD